MKPRRNHAAWVGPLLSLAGLLSYFTVAVRFPDLRDVPVLNLTVVLAGLALSVWAVLPRRSLWSVAGLAVSAVAAAALFGYVFVLSEQLPATAEVVPVGAPAPPFTLPDGEGRSVSLADFAGERVVLVFYRGFW